MAGAYGIGFGIACSVIIALVWREARRAGLASRDVAIAIAICALGGVIGSRYFTLDFHAGVYGEKTFLGAVVGGMTALLLVSRLLPMGVRAFDVPVFPLLCGGAIGRMGCLISGCCHGIVTSLPWGIRYAPGDEAFRAQMNAGVLSPNAAESLPVHPTQVYEGILDLLLAMILMRMAPKLTRDGDRALLAVAGLAMVRFAVDPFRETARPAGIFTMAQWTTLGIATVAIAVFFARRSASTSPASIASWRARFNAGQAPAMLLIAPVAALLASGWLTPMEHALVLVTTLLAAVTITASAYPRMRWGVSAAGVGFMLLQAPMDAEYPRSVATFGGAARFGGMKRHYSTLFSSSEDCTGYSTPINEVERAYSFGSAAGSVGVRHEESPQRGRGLLFTFALGRAHSTVRATRGQLASTDGPSNEKLHELSVLYVHDWTNFGLRTGVASGSRGRGKGNVSKLPTEALPIFGIRAGRRNAFAFELGFGDLQPTSIPFPFATVGVSLSDSLSRRVLKVGASDWGPYASLALRAGNYEFEPALVAGTQGRQVSLGVRRLVRLAKGIDAVPQRK